MIYLKVSLRVLNILQMIRHFFSVVPGSVASTAFLNDDLLKISRWVYQWKMIFNPDASKQAQEIVLSRKANASNHATVYFNNVPVIRDNIQKHLGLFLDSKLNLLIHINEKIKKVLKGSLLKLVGLTSGR